MNDSLNCQNEQRRDEVRKRRRNGLDYVEVGDDWQSLHVYFLRDVPQYLSKENVQIKGGQRISNIQVTGIDVNDQEAYLKINIDQPGDFSRYTLRLVILDEKGHLRPHPDFDPRYAQIQFSFNYCDTSDLDCQQQPTCPPIPLDEPNINYLAKDYASFRQLILERLSLIMPDWQERHVPDLNITLIEILAYVGDHLSYYQDAVATEAYLETARQRISVRRHVRLLDYPMHEGCNARTWVWLETSIDVTLAPIDFYFITSYMNAPTLGTIIDDLDLEDVPDNTYQVFEPVTSSPIKLYVAHNQISFYTWGDRECCLFSGATNATLRDVWSSEQGVAESTNEPEHFQRQLHLQVGDILIFQEVKGAKTGQLQDADPNHSHPVRLTAVKQDVDYLYNQPIVEISWAKEDALPFPLCISANGSAPECTFIEDISVARGNVLLVDHGRTIKNEKLGTVEGKVTLVCATECEPATIKVETEPFHPRLQKTPLTFRQPLSTKNLTQDPATSLLTQDPRHALPYIDITDNSVRYNDSNINPQWVPKRDLIDSDSKDQHFVVEIDNDGNAQLRFGDGELGKMPAGQTEFSATYRIGKGLSGNLPAEAISYIVFYNTRDIGATIQPHQPFPGIGGTDPESITQVKLFAPQSLQQNLQRAITADDYAQIVIHDFPTKVRRAAATLCWTGSYYEVLVVVEALGQEEATEKLLKEIAAHLELYRRLGHDVVVKQAVYVPLNIAMTIYVRGDYLRGHVKATLLNLFSNRILSNGQRGFFHPDNFTFNQPVPSSKLIALAQVVTGVERVTLTKLERLFEDTNYINQGCLPISPLEIAQLENNPNFPEKGQFILDMRGGR